MAEAATDPARLAVEAGLRLVAAIVISLGLGWVLGSSLIALFTALGAFFALTHDFGGSPVRRCGDMLAGTACYIAGWLAGQMLAGHPALLFLPVVVIAWLTGRVSGIGLQAELLGRFIVFGLLVGALLPGFPATFPLYLVAGTAIACAIVIIEQGARQARPVHAEPGLREVARQMFAAPGGTHRFAPIFAITVGTALLASESLGVSRPYWAAFVVLVVMRGDRHASHSAIGSTLLGTFAGILVAALVFQQSPPPWLLLVIAAVLAVVVKRAFVAHFGLGTAVMTMLLVLALDIVLPPQQGGITLLQTRLYDTFIGCAFGLVGTFLATARLPSRVA